MNKMQYYRFHILFMAAIAFVVAALFTGCDADDALGDDPYGGGKEPLGIRMLTDLPTPDMAYPGDLVTYKAQGLEPWFDEASGEYDFTFFISNEQAEIVAATDTTVTVRVPESLSTGIAYMVIDGQVFYGPKLTVLGNVSVDRDYVVPDRFMGSIFDYVEHYQMRENYYIAGSFVLMDRRYRNLMWLDRRGNMPWGWNGSYFKMDPGHGLSIDFYHPSTDHNTYERYAKSISYFNNVMAGGAPAVLISGKFTSYSTYGSNSISVSNMMKVDHGLGIQYTNHRLPSIFGGVLRDTWISAFNGGTMEAPVQSFVTSDDKVIAVGNITQYCRVDVERSYAEDLAYEFIPVRTLVRMNSDGELDEDYRNGKSGINGLILDAAIDNEDAIYMAGNLVSFDGVNVPNIIKVDKEGNLDEAFLQNIGAGANGNVTKIRYNRNRDKMMVVGSFTEFNGTAAQGVVMLNQDGTLDPDFQLRRMEGGGPNYAAILDNHDIVVLSGSFNRYDNVSRQGFLLLNMDGEAMQRFNVPGMFSGEIHQVIETRTTTNSNGLLMLGDFIRFNGELVNNIVMLEVDFD